MPFTYPNILIGFSQEEHDKTLKRLTEYKNKYNANISDKLLNNLLKRGFAFMQDETINLQTPTDVLALIWAMEYVYASQGQVSRESFLKAIDNGKYYDALVRYSEQNFETVHQDNDEEIMAYPYRRISSHSAQYSGEDRVKSLNPFSSNTIPNQHGIDIRSKTGPMLPGAKNTILFHKENPQLNSGHKILGMKYEYAGFPRFNLKHPYHTITESLAHIDQFICTRDNPAGRIGSSFFDLIKSLINLPFALLTYSYIKPFPYISSTKHIAGHKPTFSERLFQPMNDLFNSSINVVATLYGQGKYKPMGDKPFDKTSFREHSHDVILAHKNVGRGLVSFAQEVANEFKISGKPKAADEIISALKLKRIGNIVQALKDSKEDMSIKTLARFTKKVARYEVWFDDRCHSKNTEFARSGNERIADFTNQVESLKFNNRNCGYGSTKQDYNLTRKVAPEIDKDGISKAPRQQQNTYLKNQQNTISTSEAAAASVLVASTTTILSFIISSAFLATGVGALTLLACAAATKSYKDHNLDQVIKSQQNVESLGR